MTNHQPQSTKSPHPILVEPAPEYSTACDPEPWQARGSWIGEATGAEHFYTNNLNTRTGEENRDVSYLENSQDRDQALLVDEDRIQYTNQISQISVHQRAKIGTVPCPTNQNDQSFKKVPVIMYNQYQNIYQSQYQNYVIRKYQERILQQSGTYTNFLTSQHSVDDVRSKNEELLENKVCSNRLDFKTILSIENTELFKEALGLLSDHWMFKVDNIVNNYEVRHFLKHCDLILNKELRSLLKWLSMRAYQIKICLLPLT